MTETTSELITSVDGTEAAAVAAITRKGATPDTIERGGLVVIDGTVTDLEPFDDQPRRTKGLVELHDAPSLVRYCKDHEADDLLARVYIDRGNAKFVAVLNSPLVDGGALVPAWGDHRATVALRPTPEWAHWHGQNNKLLSQVDFAEHIESHLADVIEPEGAKLLEIAENIEGTKNVSFKRSNRLDNGQVRFSYIETIDGGGGTNGDLDIPTEFILAIPIFEGDAQGSRVRARLRWRISAEGLRLGYVLDRPDLVWRDAVDTQVAVVEAGLGLTCYVGLPPR